MPITVPRVFLADLATLEDGDMDPTFSLDATEKVLRTRLRRRLLTPRGALDFHPNDGFNLREYLNGIITSDTLSEIRTGCENELEKDVDVLRAECTVRYTRSTETLEVECEVETRTGPVSLNVSVSRTEDGED